ncbi:hypothetical protein LXL04_005567 [Taraxacum kok-saghyz]
MFVYGILSLNLPYLTSLVIDGFISTNSYKVCFLAQGFSHLHGLDFDDTFSLVVKLATICNALNISISRNCIIHQLDVKNAFILVILPIQFTCVNLLDMSVLPLSCAPPEKKKYDLKQGPLGRGTNSLCVPLLSLFISRLSSRFSMTNSGSLYFFLGIVAAFSVLLFFSNTPLKLEDMEASPAWKQHSCDRILIMTW